MTEKLALCAAIFSAIATALAAVATWRAPITAAKLAESLRRAAEDASERQRQKMLIFTTLMQERSEIYSKDSVRALNLIDVVFNESRDVREAWSELLSALNMRPMLNYVVDERLRRLLSAIAADLGIADQLRNDDLSRFYLPTIQAQERLIREIQLRQAFESLQAQQAEANAAGVQSTVWPPKP
ncbi:MAG TPA: DUF6680 family protein [Terriglobales bacterium]|nr:DUF6680 family protein [Terriglobales bacterium]